MSLPMWRRARRRPATATSAAPVSPLAGLDAEIRDLQAGLSRAAGDPALSALLAGALRRVRAERIAALEATARPAAVTRSPAQQHLEDCR